MTTQSITLARVYILEGKTKLDDVLKILHDQENVSGVTVTRGVAGYGESGEIHTSSLLSLSLELPLVVEFFDKPDRVEHVIQVLQRQLHLKHIISWPAISHVENTDT